MSDYAIAALANEHIRELQQQAAEARLGREATARRRSLRTARQPSVAIGTRLSRLWAGLPVHRPSASLAAAQRSTHAGPDCCVA